MNEKDFGNQPIEPDEPIRTQDKRRFDPFGTRRGGDAAAAEAEKAGPTPAEIELEAKLKAETERREAAEAKLVGVQAKFDEAKATLEKETAEMRERLKKTLEERALQKHFDFLATLLPVLDNLYRAAAASEAEGSIEHLRTGVEGTARSFEQALAAVGVEVVPGVGAEFDPEMHEAIDLAPVDAAQDGRITVEYLRGYKLGDKLLRAAKVQVGKAA